MALLRAKKEIKKLKLRNEFSVSITKSLPKELLVEIAGKVASRSIVDLCKMKLTCKEFLSASEESCVYQHASMENFALIPLPWFTDEKETSFLNRCRNSGNLEILYREGMVQYFCSLTIVDSAFENIKKAALEGHHEAKYVYSMILMNCDEDEEKRKLGFDLFGELKSSGVSVIRCRKRVKTFVQSMWVKNPVVIRNQGFSFGCSGTCETGKKVEKHSTRWCEFEDEVDAVGVSCKYCDGVYELGLFCNMFKV
uniref:F-box protein At1g67623 n=2 Tax=Cicer arietinum TaxID=3827 RepID=A0A1S2YQ94_CICAR|nr:putative F-box protein At1g67623 [Cicer arietinum]